jgi:hypothetical protein
MHFFHADELAAGRTDFDEDERIEMGDSHRGGMAPGR